MRLFCKHKYKPIKRTIIPDMPGHIGKTEYDLMCVKCGKHKVVDTYKWLLIRSRQIIRENHHE